MKNIGDLQRMAREMQANSVFHIASAGTTDPGYPIVNSADGNSVVRWKLLEDVAQGDRKRLQDIYDLRAEVKLRNLAGHLICLTDSGLSLSHEI